MLLNQRKDKKGKQLNKLRGEEAGLMEIPEKSSNLADIVEKGEEDNENSDNNTNDGNNNNGDNEDSSSVVEDEDQ